MQYKCIIIINNLYSVSVDFSAVNASYSIYPGNATIRIPIIILRDLIDENDETFKAELSINSGFENKIMLGDFSETTIHIIDGNGNVYLR